MKAWLILVLALKLRLHAHGPTIDYLAVSLGAAASWAGVPGPGEPILIAAGVIAAKHKLNIAPVLFWAWMGANAGGIVGWLVGMIAGRGVVTAPGPLRHLRLNAVARGDEVFRRFHVFAILVAPSWVSGIHRVGPVVYLVTNALSAVLWAAGIGLGAYYVGPPVLDFVVDVGWATAIGAAVLVAAGIWFEVARRRRRARESEVS